MKRKKKVVIIRRNEFSEKRTSVKVAGHLSKWTSRADLFVIPFFDHSLFLFSSLYPFSENKFKGKSEKGERQRQEEVLLNLLHSPNVFFLITLGSSITRCIWMVISVCEEGRKRRLDLKWWGENDDQRGKNEGERAKNKFRCFCSFHHISQPEEIMEMILAL